jgi:hypothetical protein
VAAAYNATTRTNRLKAVRDQVDSKTWVDGSGAGSAGSLVLGTSALSGATGVLATVPLPNPGSTVSGDVLTIAGLPLSAAASAAGTIAKAELRNNAGTAILTGLSAGTSGSDVTVNTTTTTVGQTVTVTAAAITHPT